MQPDRATDRATGRATDRATDRATGYATDHTTDPVDSTPSSHTHLTRWRSSENRPLVFLHGFGGHPGAYDLDLLASTLGSTSILRVKGPIAVDQGFAWWDGDNGEDPSPEAWAAALDALTQQLPPTTEPVVLVGFSQGAAVVIGAALQEAGVLPCPIAAVVAVAGFLAFPPDAAATAPPVQFVHPTDDSVVDIFLAERAARLLQKIGVDATLSEIDGDHTWSSAVVAPAVDFLLTH